MAPSPAPVIQQPISQQSTGVPSSPTAAPGPVRVPALTPEKISEYAGLFEKSGAENGQLAGFTAKQIFERARLPNDVLGRIWGLADTQGRGALDVSEFIIAMHLLASFKSGAMRGVPNTLPPGLLDAASRRAPIRLSGGPLPGRPTSSAGIQQMQPQSTGYRPQSPIINRQYAGTPLSAQSTGDPWMISGPDKMKFDQIFSTIDTAGQGFISGEQAVTFFGNARLPEEALAQIWDLADINSDGVLNRDEFAVAMFLIRQHRGSRDGRLPQVLPTALVPPSMRKQIQPSQPQTMPAFDDAPITKPRSAADDLFGLDVSEQVSQQTAALPQVAQSTGGTDAGPFANPRTTASPPPSSNIFKPFVPSSNFGQGLTSQSTGASQPPTRALSLMDEEDSAPPKLNNDAAELGNLSNQVGNLSKQMQDVSGQRSQAEQELSQNNQQKQMFQQRLTQLRSVYDQEVAQVKALKDQLAASQAETKRLQQDMAMIEGTHADLQTQRQQLASALAADQQENANLKERIRATNAETEQLKPQLEKLKSDARQQKGLVAINKKQLATNETERDRIRAEIAAAQQEIEAFQREAEESARQLEQSHRELEQAKAVPVPTPAPRELVSPPLQVASPTPSTSSNPFFRRQDSGAVFSPPTGSAIASPVVHQEQDKNTAFDSIFGPSFGAAGAAPVTSFGQEKTQGSETPLVVEPPAPPEQSQILSSALPLRAPLTREDSISSSVLPQPASRLSPAHTPRALTPDTSTASPISQRNDDPFQTAAADEEQESVRQTLPRGTTTEMIDTVPGAFPGSRPETPAQKGVDPTSVAVGAAAATLAAGVGLGAAAAIHQEEKKPEVLQKDNFDDIFGGPNHKKTLSQQHADFDSAFAGMDATKPSNGTASSGHEFPAIPELDNDDDSSDDDSSAKGFDDNFAPVRSSNAAGKQPEQPIAQSTLPVPQPLDSTPPSSSLPPFTQQASPPDYKEVVPQDNPNHFPLEYKNLLPEREDPTSPTAAESAQPPSTTAIESASYGPEATSRDVNQSESHVREQPPTKAAPFDFDSAFVNMGAAPVADDSDSEYDDATPGTSRKQTGQLSEFDPTFDSPAPSTRTMNTIGTSQTAGFSAHDAVTVPQTNGSIQSAVPTQTSFDDFAETSPFSQARQITSPSTVTPGVSHDWDALFAPLDAQKQQEQVTSPAGAPLDRVTSNASIQQATEIAPGRSALTTADEVPSESPSPIPPTAAATSIPATTNTPSSPKASSLLKPARPQPGRALSEGTEHDDPILKRLTAMGWSRQQSLEALEKFDYNIDKVCDFLVVVKSTDT